MLETFRKHHYVLMCFIAAVVIVTFTFLFNPNQYDRGAAGGGQRAGTLYGEDFTTGQVRAINEEQGIAADLMRMTREQGRENPASQFLQAMNSLVNSMSPTDRDAVDLDYPTNVLVMRRECDHLGIDVERPDIESFINRTFDAKKIKEFLETSTSHGDKAATESKLYSTVRDIMRFQRVAELVGGKHEPSKAEIDQTYAQNHQRTTAVTILIEKKKFEDQAVTDEEIQKYYDAEKAKKEAAKPDDKTAAAVDPAVLSEEKRTVKCVFAEEPAAPVAPATRAPKPPDALPAKEDTSKLPEDQKKVKDEEYAKKEEEFKKKQEEYTKANEEYTKQMAEHAKKVTEHTEAKKKWLENVAELSNRLVAEERGAKTFEEIAKELGFEVKTETFTKSAAPADLQKIKGRMSFDQATGSMKSSEGLVDFIFSVPKDGPEAFMGDQEQKHFCAFQVTGIEDAALLPLEQVKQKISDKLKAEKVAAKLKEAADSARSNILEALKAGRNIKEAAEAAGLTANELPPFSSERPLPQGTPNQSVITSAIGRARGAVSQPLNAGDLSEAKEVPEGLLLVYVDKVELPNVPDLEEQKKSLAESYTRKDAMSPVLEEWFAERRKVAQTVQP